MPQELVRFWLNYDNGIVHRDTCAFCQLADTENSPKWWGPYATKGAAIDAGLTIRDQVYECGAGGGCGPKQVNPA